MPQVAPSATVSLPAQIAAVSKPIPGAMHRGRIKVIVETNTSAGGYISDEVNPKGVHIVTTKPRDILWVEFTPTWHPYKLWIRVCTFNAGVAPT